MSADSDLGTRLFAALEAAGEAAAVLAMREEGEPERWSATELADAAARIAGALSERGFAAGDGLVLLAASSPRWIATCLAVWRLGGVVVSLDAQFPSEVLDAVLDDCAAGWIAVDAGTAARLDEVEARSARRRIRLDADDADDLADAAADTLAFGVLRAAEPAAAAERDADERAVLFYTSGTTGRPKGVPLSHRNLAYQLGVVAELELLRPGHVVLLPLPLHHVYPFVLGILAPLAAGNTVVLPAAFTGPAVLGAIRDGGVTTVVGVPRLYRALMQGLDARLAETPWPVRPLLRGALALSSLLRRRLHLRCGKWLLRPLHAKLGTTLRIMASGGSPLDPELGWRLEAMGWRVTVGYGLTETSPMLTLLRPGEGHLDSVGQAVPGTELRLARDVAEGLAAGEGELQARGPGVFAGYHHRPEADAEAFTDDGWYRTGDLGRFNDAGYLHLTGRLSTMLVTPGGENIQPENVEEVYEREVAIAEIGILQEGDDLVGLVVPDRSAIAKGEAGNGTDDVERAVADALSRAGRQLPSYQRLSDHRLTTTPLPRTRLGKIRRKALAEAWEAAAEGGDAARRTGPAAIDDLAPEDRRRLEDPRARAAWELLCERFPDRPVEPDADLQFDLGLDSMAWLDLTLALRMRSGVELDEDTIAGLDDVRSLLAAVASGSETNGAAVAGASPVAAPHRYLSERQRRYLRELHPGERAAARLLERLGRGLLRHACHLKVEGSEHLPNDGPCIIAPNHLSMVDPPVVAVALGRRRLQRTWWIGFAGAAFGNPFTRLVSRLGRTVPVDPRGGAASSLAVGSLILRAGRMLVWFPEGERSPDGELRPFRPGIGHLLTHHRVPVIPAHITGSYQVMPRGQALPRPHAVRLRFGPALRYHDLVRDDDERAVEEQIAARLQEVVAELGHPPAG